MNGTIIEHDSGDYSDKSYRICITCTGKIVTRSTRYSKETPITAEQYLRDQVTKSSGHKQINDDVIIYYYLQFCIAFNSTTKCNQRHLP